MSDMKVIDWNEISRLGLHERINREIMHPLGLAIFRVVETGVSPGAYVSPDGVFEYASRMSSSDSEGE
ncbi:hypothetical protein [Pseudomonas sp. MH9.3]|uniref:DUF7415 domain-containing protein n=1 Tax=Pseudomonas sp. MH9.3 TaxID=3048630 RepID=UPI002AC93A89|nr:hypothetical protein [Pseudomonas sp. MH9.3]MEB0106658.1 hypothetical protein [Pseudomonas sp. MH9.3]WPX81251.1 hypothetical protein RHM60_09125 [Pseudomonas sp. MH9.3]WQG57064.1 hypothetical protein RHM66_17590 [Pseudomonas sp. RTB3]